MRVCGPVTVPYFGFKRNSKRINKEDFATGAGTDQRYQAIPFYSFIKETVLLIVH